MRRLVRVLRMLGVLFVLGVSGDALAHPALGTVASAGITRDGGSVFVDLYVTHDALAYALNDTSVRVTDQQMYALLHGPREDLAAALQDGRERFENGFRVFGDGQRLKLEIRSSPDLESVDRWRERNPSQRLPMKHAFEARVLIPEGTDRLMFRPPAVLGELMLGVSRPGMETVYVPLSAGEESPEFDIGMLWLMPDDPNATDPRGPDETASRSAPIHDEVSHAGIVWRYIVLGYRHIIPDGHDHELFILGLFLLNTKLKDLLWQTTAFTIAHTTTLTLATFGMVSAPSDIVEPLIALSIAAIAIENIFAKEAHPWRLAIAFFFGLVHGLGFASGLMEIGLPTSQLLTGLLAFNVGVEGGHLSILAAAFLTIGWFKEKAWYRARISIPLSVAIALIALFWFVQRVL